MSRLSALDPEKTSGKQKELLDGVQQKLGKIPNLMRTMANSAAVLDAYLGFSTSLSRASISPTLREQIALTVGEANNCDYCLAAHSAIGKQLGLSESDLLEARGAHSADTKTESALQFARRIVQQRGKVTDVDVERVRHAGYGDDQISEIVAVVALNLFTNYFNHVAGTEVDFPSVSQTQCACN